MLGFASIIGSIAIWYMTGRGNPEALAHGERFGIFVGLWAPTFFILSNRFDRYATMPAYVPMKVKPSLEQTSRIIRYAWEDRTSFEEIEERTGLTEKQVIDVMRRALKPASFRLWRKRVCGRVTKHRRLLEQHLKGPLSEE